MNARFIARILDPKNVLLAWAEVWATAKPQERGASCPFWSLAPTRFVVETSGVAAQISIHWAELDIARKDTLPEPVPMQAGQVFMYTWLGPVWLVPGMRDVPLPQVTVRQPVAIGVPVGELNAVSK